MESRKAEEVRIYGSGFECYGIAIVTEGREEKIRLLCDVFMLRSVCRLEAERINVELKAAETTGGFYIFPPAIYASTSEA